MPSQHLSPKIPPVTRSRARRAIPHQWGWLLPWPGPSISCDSWGSAGTRPIACPPGPAPVQAVRQQDTGWGLFAPKPGRGGGRQRVRRVAELPVPAALSDGGTSCCSICWPWAAKPSSSSASLWTGTHRWLVGRGQHGRVSTLMSSASCGGCHHSRLWWQAPAEAAHRTGMSPQSLREVLRRSQGLCRG